MFFILEYCFAYDLLLLCNNWNTISLLKLTRIMKHIIFIYPLINITCFVVLFPMCRNPLPEAVQSILEEGIDLYKLHTKIHGRSVL